MNNLADVRKDLGLSQRELGEHLGWGQSRIANYENGDRIPSLAVARKLCNALNALGANVSVDTLFPPTDN